MIKMENSSNAAKLKVVGVGGAGGNAINDMIQSEINDVEFIAINTDQQDLDRSVAGKKVLLGKGMGAGADPEKGRIAAKESEEKIKEVLEGTDMLFITAGMGGGTGTGASPIVAEIAKSMGILTVAVVTKPFEFEGALKKNNADAGIENLKEQVDTLIAIPNDKLFELPNVSITLMTAFKEANSVLRVGIKGISDLITKQGFVNLDFAAVKAIMQDSGIAMLGFGEGSGDGKAKTATEQALNSPLLEKSIEGAQKVLLNITAGQDIGLHEIREVSETVSKKTGSAGATLIWGVILDPELEGTIKVSLIATDFKEVKDVEKVTSGMVFTPHKEATNKTGTTPEKSENAEKATVKNGAETEKKSENGVEKEEVPEMGDENKENDFIGDGFVVPPFFEE